MPFKGSGGQQRLTAIVLLTLAISVAALIAVFRIGVHWFQEEALEREIRGRTATVQKLYTTTLRDDAERLQAVLGVLSRDSELQARFHDRDRAALLRAAGPLFTRLKAESPVTHLYFIEPDGTCFLRVHAPGEHGDHIDRVTLRSAASSGGAGSGIELGPLGTVTLRVVAPWHEGERLLGYLELGEEIDHIARDIAAILGVDIGVLIDKEFLDQAAWQRGMRLLGRPADWSRYVSYVLVDKTLPRMPSTLETHLTRDSPLDSIVRFTSDTEHYAATFVPLPDASDRPVGRLLVVNRVSQQVSAAKEALLAVTIGGGAGAILLLAFLFFITRRAERDFSLSRGRLLSEVLQRDEQNTRHIAELEAERQRLEQAQHQLTLSEERLRAAQRIAHVGNWDWNIPDNTLYWSDEIYCIFGVLPQEFGATYEAFIEFVHPEDRDYVISSVRTAFDHGGYDIVHRILRPSGVVRIVREQAELTRDDSGKPIRMMGTVHDVTEQKQLDDFARRIGHILDNATNEIHIIDAGTLQILHSNHTALQNLGYELAEITRLTLLDIGIELGEESLRTTLATLKDGGNREQLLETVLSRRDGSIYPVEMRLQYSSTQTQPALIAICLDITERLSHRQELEYQALHDGLTGLPNRNLLLDRLQYEVANCVRKGDSLAVMLFDINRLKEYNDTLGHRSGDLILKQFAERLRTTLRDTDTVARLAGDEFCALLPGVNLDQIRRVLEKVQKAMEAQFAIEHMRLNIEVSIGIAIFPDHGPEANALIQHADIALHQAKDRKCGYAFYDTEYDPFSVRRLMLIGHLRHSIDKEELSVHYQPKVDVHSGEVQELEALVRWHHGHHGPISPAEFIPLAEQTGFIRPLTRWVMDEVLSQIRQWNQQGERLRVAVNLSARNLLEPHLTEQVKGLLDKWQVAPAQLSLEITESAIMIDPQHSMKVLGEFDSMGVRLAIDDYGTGYSSLAYLKQLPADELKIDKSFVTDMMEDEDNAVITRSTIDLAHNLGLEVTAEGVESQEAADLLAILGCDQMQGYYIGRPMPAESVLPWLGTRRNASGCVVA